MLAKDFLFHCHVLAVVGDNFANETRLIMNDTVDVKWSKISHLRKLPIGRWIIQSNDDHQRGVAERAEAFAAEFGMGEWKLVLELLHDKGKLTTKK